MHRKKLMGAVIAVCAVVAVTAGIAQGSGTKSTTRTAHASRVQSNLGGPPGGPLGSHPSGRPGAEEVHSVSVVLDKAGKAFITQTSDRGTVQSADASAKTVTIVEGTKSVSYKTLTLTIPSGATVIRNGKTATLSDLVAGDRVSVSSSSEGTTVFAADSSFHPDGGPGRGGPGGPPPGQGSSSTSKALLP